MKLEKKHWIIIAIIVAVIILFFILRKKKIGESGYTEVGPRKWNICSSCVGKCLSPMCKDCGFCIDEEDQRIREQAKLFGQNQNNRMLAGGTGSACCLQMSPSRDKEGVSRTSQCIKYGKKKSDGTCG